MYLTYHIIPTLRLRRLCLLLGLLLVSTVAALAQNDRTFIRQGNRQYRARKWTAAEVQYRKAIARNANIAESYDDYVRLGFALANGLGSAGRDLYHQLCAHSTKYRQADCERKWQQCLHQADGRTSIATFYHMARQAGVDISTITKQYRKNHLNY